MSYFDWNQMDPTDPNEKKLHAPDWNGVQPDPEQEPQLSGQTPETGAEGFIASEKETAREEAPIDGSGTQEGFNRSEGFYARKADEIYQSDLGRETGSAYRYTGYTDPTVYNETPSADSSRHENPVRQEKTAEGRKKKSFAKRAVAMALCCTLLGAGAGFGGGYLASGLKQSGTAPSDANGSAGTMVVSTRENTPISVATADTGKLLTAAEVYAKNVNSTVGITTEITTTNYWGFRSTAAAAGSGFILSDNGYILTNYHVIENANTITVAMYDGTKYQAALIGYDVSNDIAVLKIEAEGLTPVVLGSSDDLVVGQDVVAIGNPLGELTFSLTRGAVSALNRTVSLSSSVTMELIQTDCAINAGNSGGALFNLYGEVVGITNAKYSSSSMSEASIDNIGFAIPINTVRELVTSIIEKGYVTKPYIGVSVGTVSEESQSYGMPKGAAIRSVEKDSPAEKAGLQANDIITAADGKTVTGFQDLSEVISKAEAGQELKLTVYRRGETLEITVTVGEVIQSATEQTNQSGNNQSGGNPFGWGN